jgi:succinate dehydrogenase / fumarate reductase flavoprotein subunit
MQGLADGYFVLPYTVANYLAQAPKVEADENHPAAQEAVKEVKERMEKFLSIRGSRSPDSFHRELGQIIWDNCGMARTKEGLEGAIEKIKVLRDLFWKDLRVLGNGDELNVSLEKAGRVADFFELGELMCRDALMRSESCGGHFREESQTEEGEAKRDDENFQFAAAWEFTGVGNEPTLHKEDLTFDYVKPSQRSYK